MASSTKLMDPMSSLEYMDYYYDFAEPEEPEEPVRVGDFALVTKSTLVKERLRDRGFRGYSLFGDIEILTGYVKLTPQTAQANPHERRDNHGVLLGSIAQTPCYYLSGVMLRHRNGAIFGSGGQPQADLLFYDNQGPASVDYHIQRIVVPTDIYPAQPDVFIPEQFRPLR